MTSVVIHAVLEKSKHRWRYNQVYYVTDSFICLWFNLFYLIFVLENTKTDFQKSEILFLDNKFISQRIYHVVIKYIKVVSANEAVNFHPLTCKIPKFLRPVGYYHDGAPLNMSFVKKLFR